MYANLEKKYLEKSKELQERIQNMTRESKCITNVQDSLTEGDGGIKCVNLSDFGNDGV